MTSALWGEDTGSHEEALFAIKAELKSGGSNTDGVYTFDAKDGTHLLVFLLFVRTICSPFRQFMQFLQAVSEPWAVEEHLQKQLMSVVSRHSKANEES